MSNTCAGQTKAGTQCTKKVKASETHCHLHRENKEIKEEKVIKIEKPIISNTISAKDHKLREFDSNHLNIWTWNINGIRNKVELVNNLLLKHNIDILLLTETKITSKFENILTFLDGYDCLWNSNKNSYHHGIAFIYRKELKIEVLNNILPIKEKIAVINTNDPLDFIQQSKKNQLNNNSKNYNIIKKYEDDIEVDTAKAHNTEGRILVVKCNDIVIVGTYVPNAGVDRKEALKRLAYRTKAWDVDIYHYLSQLEQQYRKVIWLGDLNVTICDNDLLNIKANIAGTTIEERNNINNFLKDNNWIDTWQQHNPDIKDCWNRATWGVDSTFPLRLDYVLCSSVLKDNIVFSVNDQLFEGSDHIPMGTKFKL